MTNPALSASLEVGARTYTYYPVSQIEGADRLPLALTVLLENVLRCARTEQEARAMAARVVEAGLAGKAGDEVEFLPARVLFQDFTGVPVFVDFAAMREACCQLGGDPALINPQIPCDLVIDHSVIADVAGCPTALERNTELEFERNRERYSFLKWAQRSFSNVRIVPPGQGICHQLNIEKFAPVVMTASDGSDEEACDLAYFDTLVGTDSHTPTANGIGVLGWGVGGIEAEAAALGQPITTLVPASIGVHLTGSLPDGATGMDLALRFAQMLRAEGVVGCFVECFGDGVSGLTATQRACVSNMTPEYGSTCTLFPVDDQTLEYLRLTGRSAEQIDLVRAYAQAQGTFGAAKEGQRVYAKVIELDLATVRPAISGPSRPHDRFDLATAQQRFASICADRGLDLSASADVELGGKTYRLTHGALAIAAITSCTTATDPAMMLAAGLVARNAASRGLHAKPWVKTILAPGSHATELLLERAGLLDGLAALGFNTCGFGCMSCIGNSGPILPAMHDIAGNIELTSILSGNRNFDGRISPDVSQNFLTAPGNVVAYALAGTMDFDLATDPLGTDEAGAPIFYADIAPDPAELAELLATHVTADLYECGAAGMFEGDDAWRRLEAAEGDLFEWDESSLYVRRPPYFDGMTRAVEPVAPVANARVLANLGDFITTDHISPAGSIAPDSPAAHYLEKHGVAPADFNTYGSRRGNHEVMMRGTLANVKLHNHMADGRTGGWTRNVLTGQIVPLFDAACAYEQAGFPSVILAGKMYGSGSSRDWAAKAPLLVGVRAVIAESFERIHRSNLIGMGILPLQFLEGQSAGTFGFDGTETFDIAPIDAAAYIPETLPVRATRADGSICEFQAKVRIDTPTEGEYYAHGGILQFVLRQLAK